MSPTAKQSLGKRGEGLVARVVRCPGCKRPERTFRTPPANFKCADVICDFCGYLAQVKTKTVKGPLTNACPTLILGAAWGPQKARMDAGVYFSLYVVLENEQKLMSIFFLPPGICKHQRCSSPGLLSPQLLDVRAGKVS